MSGRILLPIQSETGLESCWGTLLLKRRYMAACKIMHSQMGYYEDEQLLRRLLALRLSAEFRSRRSVLSGFGERMPQCSSELSLILSMHVERHRL